MYENNYTLKYTLKQHSILIHFQAKYEDGANVCLRASEVKPKLDRFLVKYLGGIEKVLSAHMDWVQVKNPNGVDLAFKYRMVITSDGGDVTIYESKLGKNSDPPNKLPSIFYGNMSIDPKVRKKYGVFFAKGLTVKIICFDRELAKFLDEHIAEFFVITNFGTMQDKGFGSFTVEDEKINYSKALKSNYNAKKCFVIETKKYRNTSKTQNELFGTIKQVYSVMKSGQNFVGRDGNTITDKYIRSFIYVYMHQKHNIGNEKSAMKKNKVAPIRTTHTPINTHEHNKQADLEEFCYVRALLGIGENMEWIEQKDEQRKDDLRKEKINISDVTKDKAHIERFASPIFFKIIENNIYITANQPDQRIFGRCFRFENRGYTKQNQGKSPRRGNSIELSTLSKQEGSAFDIADFLMDFMSYYNSNIGKLKIKHKIEEVR